MVVFVENSVFRSERRMHFVGRVSVLQKARVQGDLIREWIGHTSPPMTSKYTHLDDEYKAKVISELPKA